MLRLENDFRYQPVVVIDNDVEVMAVAFSATLCYQWLGHLIQIPEM